MLVVRHKKRNRMLVAGRMLKCRHCDSILNVEDADLENGFVALVRKREKFTVYTAMCPVCWNETKFRRYNNPTSNDLVVSSYFYTDHEIRQCARGRAIVQARRPKPGTGPAATRKKVLHALGRMANSMMNGRGG